MRLFADTTRTLLRQLRYALMKRGDDGWIVRRMLVVDDSAVVRKMLRAALEKQLVKEVVDNMPAHYREILLLSYFQKLSYNQIADSLQIPLGTVKSRLHASAEAEEEDGCGIL